MKKYLVLTYIASLGSVLLAQPAPQPMTPSTVAKASVAPGQTHNRVDPTAISNILAKTGGIVQVPAKGPAILFLNAQKRIPGETVRESAEQLERLLRLPCVVRDQPAVDPVAAAVKSVSDPSTAAVIVVGDAAGYPSLLLAPENRWALVNVTALGGANTSAKQLSDRTQKELVRAFGMLLGASISTRSNCVLQPVLSPEDLDAMTVKNLSVEPLNKILFYTQKLGIRPARVTTYRKAVEEGWASPPTNDFQRAIWKELRK